MRTGIKVLRVRMWAAQDRLTGPGSGNKRFLIGYRWAMWAKRQQ